MKCVLLHQNVDRNVIIFPISHRLQQRCSCISSCSITEFPFKFLLQ